MKSPLADMMRPTSIEDVFGQEHLIAPGKTLRNLIDRGVVPNLIFYGPSGVGKTTVAKILANKSGRKMKYMNATIASSSDIKDVVQESINDPNGILLYLDEIQYFNKKQQQILLSYVESGDITLIAATTENPYFYVYPALLSRATAFEFKSLNAHDVQCAVKNAIKKLNQQYKIEINDAQCLKIAQSSAGDVRKALNLLELIVSANMNHDALTITTQMIDDVITNNGVRYDRDGDQHYDLVSAYQKAMRGSDPDASLYYLGRILAAGDLPSACRRLLVCANEDVGLAYPQIIPIVKSAVDTAMMVGLPEARLPLANAVVLVALSPKSNSTHDAINAVMHDIERGLVGDIPRHLQNKHYDGLGAEVKGQHYKYPHDYPNHYVNQQYLPDDLVGKKYYVPCNNNTEKKFKDYWKTIR